MTKGVAGTLDRRAVGWTLETRFPEGDPAIYCLAR